MNCQRQCGGLSAELKMLYALIFFLFIKGNKQNPLFPGLALVIERVRVYSAFISQGCYHKSCLIHYSLNLQLVPSPWDPLTFVILPNSSESELVVKFPLGWGKVRPNTPSVIVNLWDTLTSCSRVVECTCEKAHLALSGGLGMRMQVSGFRSLGTVCDCVPCFFQS